MIPSDIQITTHAADQMRKRGITSHQVMNVLEYFDCFRETSTARGCYIDLWNNGIRVTLARDGRDFLTKEYRWVIVTVAHTNKRLHAGHGGFVIGDIFEGIA